MLRLTCFGEFKVELDGQRLTQFHSGKARALLLYLAVGPQRHARGTIANLLWSDYSEQRARRNLSQTLTTLRKLIPEIIQSDTSHVWLQAELSSSIDVIDFERLLSQVASHVHHSIASCPDCTDALQQAFSLYTAHFLDPLTLEAGAEFEQWVLARRERLFQLGMGLFTQLAQLQETRGELDAAVATGRFALQLAPWHEATHQTVMRLLAKQGQRSQALAQYDGLADALMTELGVSPSAESDALYDDILAGNIAPAATPTIEVTRVEPPFLAPSLSPHFVGRSELSERLANQLNQPNQPPVALVGMGGSGKTSLATAYAHAHRDVFPDGILWANTQTSDAANTLELWGRVYGNDFSGLTDLDSRAAAVRGMLSNKRALLMLDNVEDAALARPLIPSGSQCSVLCTTRNADVAAVLNAYELVVGDLLPAGSLALLTSILGEERVHANPSELAAAHEIGQLLHHLPLAVEIAAQRLKTRPRMRLVAFAQRLRDTRQRMSLAISDRAVRTSFQLSWEALDAILQETFAALAIFEGRSFAVPALEAVLDSGIYETEDRLYNLAALSLVKESDSFRYQQHPLMADFAAEMLQEDQLYRQRMVDYFQQFAARHHATPLLLAPEWENLLAAVENAYALEQWQAVIATTTSLRQPWLRSGRYSDALRALKLAAEAANKLGDTLTYGKMRLFTAEIKIEQSRYKEALDEIESAQQSFYAEEDDAGVARAAYFKGFVYFDQGHYELAITELSQAKQLLQDKGSSTAMAETIDMLASVYFETDESTTRAKTLAEEALAMHHQANSAADKRIPTLRLLATIAQRENDLETATTFTQEAIAICQQTNNLVEEGSAFYISTMIARLQKDFPRALSLAEETLALFERVGNQRHVGILHYELSQIHFATGRFPPALEHVEKALEIYKRIEERLGYGYALRQLGDIHAALGQNQKSLAAWREAQQLAQFLKHAHLSAQLEERLSDGEGS